LVLIARRKDKLEEVARKIKSNAADCDVMVLVADLGKEKAQNVVDQVVNKFGSEEKETNAHFPTRFFPVSGVDALVNNAAKLTMFQGDDFDVDKFNDLMNVNVTSPTALTKAALPKLRETKGSAVFVSSAGSKIIN